MCPDIPRFTVAFDQSGSAHGPGHVGVGTVAVADEFPLGEVHVLHDGLEFFEVVDEAGGIELGYKHCAGLRI